MKTITEKREQRKKNTAEVFTPDSLVNDMLNKLPEENWNEGKTFCDPACGDGQFLVHVLKRKLDKGHNPLKALKSIYGVDIMKDNIRICRMRLLALISKYDKITKDHVYSVFRNIVWTNINKYPNGSLDYDFSFKNGINTKHVRKWLKEIDEGKLEEVIDTLPVTETKTNKDRMLDNMQISFE